MTTEQERIARWKLIAFVLVAAIGAGLLVYGYISGDQWLKALGIGAGL